MDKMFYVKLVLFKISGFYPTLWKSRIKSVEEHLTILVKYNLVAAWHKLKTS